MNGFSRMSAFLNENAGRDIICYGAGSLFQVMCCDLARRAAPARITAVLDRDPAKDGRFLCEGGLRVPVYSPERAARELDFAGAVLLITTARPRAVRAYLRESPIFRGLPTAAYAELKQADTPPLRELPDAAGALRIPKRIHYCWFGGRPMPENLRRCMDSWRRFCPDYDIQRWDESNYDVGASPYTRLMHQKKKWAFLSDYARMEIVSRHGGVYLDTDVELLRGLDPLLAREAFIGTEAAGGVNSGLGFGAVKGIWWAAEMLRRYEAGVQSGSPFLFTSNVGKETALFSQYGYCNNGRFQMVRGTAVYPFQVFSPMIEETGALFCTEATVSIHHFQGSWKQGRG